MKRKIEKYIERILWVVIIAVIALLLLCTCAKIDMYESNRYYKYYGLDILVIDSLDYYWVYVHDETGVHNYKFVNCDNLLEPGDTLFIRYNYDLKDHLKEVY
jgi:hypothetical protein